MTQPKTLEEALEKLNSQAKQLEQAETELKHIKEVYILVSNYDLRIITVLTTLTVTEAS